VSKTGKLHDVYGIKTDPHFLYLTVDQQLYRVRWEDCSKKLFKATMEQRNFVKVSPSGYGLHWPLIDEDLAIDPLLQFAEALED
jgi:hypothetical protein